MKLMIHYVINPFHREKLFDRLYFLWNMQGNKMTAHIYVVVILPKSPNRKRSTLSLISRVSSDQDLWLNIYMRYFLNTLTQFQMQTAASIDGMRFHFRIYKTSRRKRYTELLWFLYRYCFETSFTKQKMLEFFFSNICIYTR